MAAFVFNQANNTVLNTIPPLGLWAGSDITNLWVQSSKLEATSGNVYASTTAYLNEAGSSYAVVRFSALQGGQGVVFIRSSTGLNTTGYAFTVNELSGNLNREGANVASYTYSAGHNAYTTATEVRIEQVAPNVRVYVGPIGAAVLIGTYNDTGGPPLSGGFSGFKMTGGGTVTPSITAFDNGVAAYEARITWAEAQYQSSGVSPSTDYSEPLSRGIFRGIERGVA
jgi:hypothetical protein